MKQLIIATCYAIALLLSGCDVLQPAPDDYTIFAKSYILQYVGAEQMRLFEGADQQGIGIYFQGTYYHASSSAIIPDSEDGTTLSQYFCDVSFNRKISLLKLQSIYLADEFTGIEITSDRDFDATHPAGIPR